MRRAELKEGLYKVELRALMLLWRRPSSRECRVDGGIVGERGSENVDRVMITSKVLSRVAGECVGVLSLTAGVED